MYITNGLDNVIEDFKNAREGSTKVLVTVTDGYTHPSIQASDVQDKLDQLADDIQLHAISRSYYRRKEECNFASQARTNVCQRRADVLEMLNGNKNEKIYMYSDAQSTHDVIEAGCNSCPRCPGAPGGKVGEIGEVGEDGPDKGIFSKT